jgi:hypothetical protein
MDGDACGRSPSRAARIDIDTGNAVEMTGKDRRKVSPPSRSHGSCLAWTERGDRATAQFKDIQVVKIRSFTGKQKG